KESGVASPLGGARAVKLPRGGEPHKNAEKPPGVPSARAGLSTTSLLPVDCSCANKPSQANWWEPGCESPGKSSRPSTAGAFSPKPGRIRAHYWDGSRLHLSFQSCIFLDSSS